MCTTSCKLSRTFVAGVLLGLPAVTPVFAATFVTITITPAGHLLIGSLTLLGIGWRSRRWMRDDAGPCPC